MSFVRTFGWIVALFLIARGGAMLFATDWWLHAIEGMPDAGRSAVYQARMLGSREMIVGGFVVVSLMTDWAIVPGLWMASLVSAGYFVVDAHCHWVDGATSFGSVAFLQDHVGYPMFIVYTALLTIARRQSESRYLERGLVY